jgi:hypothetical protein
LYFENSAYYHGEKDIAASGKLNERGDCFEETAEYINGYFSASDVSESRMWATSKVKKLFNTNKFLLPAEYLTKTQTIDFKQTVGVSFLLHSHYLYGLPQRPDRHLLQDTLDSPQGPYHLFNKDIFPHHPFEDRGSLYGSIPYITAHSAKADASVLWRNAAETFVEIW